MTRSEGAGHKGAVGKPHRCGECEHRPKRIVSFTTKRHTGMSDKPRQHKKPCDCSCHSEPS